MRKSVPVSGQANGDREERSPNDLPPPELLASEAPGIASDKPSSSEEVHIKEDDLRLICETLNRAVALTDRYHPLRNPGSSMRQLRTLFASARLRAALSRFSNDHRIDEGL